MVVRSTFCVFMVSVLLAGMCQYMAFTDNSYHVTLNKVITQLEDISIVSYEVEIT